MDTSTEIRKLLPSAVRELAQILDYNDSWKKLMDKIPKVLVNDHYQCKLSRHNPRKYRSEHFKLIENASKTTGRSCTEILFDEWGTSGRIRPSLGHLLFLLTTVELFRAADYVAEKLLNTDLPPRPIDGPAALITTTLPERPVVNLQEVDRILDAMAYPSSVISNLNDSSYNVNVNKNVLGIAAHIIPKIVVSKIPDSSRNSSQFIAPLVTENRKKRMVRQDASVAETSISVSDMIEFSKSQSMISDSDAPKISTLMSSDSASLPALSALNLNSTADILSSNQTFPALSELLSVEVPRLSNLLQTESVLPEPNSPTDNIPNLSALNLAHSNNSLSQTSLISNANAESSDDPLPQFSTLLSEKQVHFLPIADHTADILSETSSCDSLKTSNASSELSQNSNSSRISRNTCASPLPNLSLNTLLPHFTYQEIESATNNFDETPHRNCRQVENAAAETNGRFLGSGAFGSVFLALNIMDKPVAVKKLFLGNVDVVNVDDPVTKQFKNEVEVLSKYKHTNLLSLVGYSCDGPTYCLLYEFIPGGALKDRLQCTNDCLMWMDRLYIALGTAKAVSYLHTAYGTPLIHRDIKTANILLDCSNKPKLCDFGLIKLISNQNTNTSTTAFGTSAYMAREAFRGDVSVKLDTFSFGVVLLELITGLPPLDENREGLDIITHVEEICEDVDSIAPLIDTKAGPWVMRHVNYAEELYKIATKCLEENKKNRPTMVDVTQKLVRLIK